MTGAKEMKSVKVIEGVVTEYNYRGLLFSVYNNLSGNDNVWFASAHLRYHTHNKHRPTPGVKTKCVTTPEFSNLDDAIDVMENMIDDFLKYYF